MSNIARMMQRATAGAGGAGLDVDDVFSTFLYKGNNSTQTITNNIDLSGEGGLVWIKNRSTSSNHSLFDSESGATGGKKLRTNLTSGIQTFNGSNVFTTSSTGFALNNDASNDMNDSTYDYVSWTFRKAPKFFDVVTWTSNGSGSQRVNHNLGAVPGHIVMKRTDADGPWLMSPLYSDGDRGYRQSSSTFGFDSTGYIGTKTSGLSSGFTATDFRPEYIDGYGTYTNINGATFVAYLFAHNNGDGEFGPDGDADIIKCGSYTGNGSTQSISLGFEPQFIFLKSASSSSNWVILDSMRGVVTSSSAADDKYLFPNSNTSEGGGIPMNFTATGFDLANEDTSNKNGNTFIYMAIRRGPLAVPDDATKVFAMDTSHSDNNNTVTGDQYTAGFPVDFAWQRRVANTGNFVVGTRLLGKTFITTDTHDVEGANNDGTFDHQTGWYSGSTTISTSRQSWMWRRAPGYFDVVAYTGNNNYYTSQNITHNLGVVPEMIWIKNRDRTASWAVYSKTIGAQKKLDLDGTSGASANDSAYFNNTTPTSSVFTVGNSNRVNQANESHVAYLFATVAGVSKVGSVSHTNGSTTNVDCGFSSGARFILLKRYNDTGNWVVFDSTRGIVAGNDPYLLLDKNDAEDSYGASDAIDPLSSGFTITGNFFTTGDYIFYAIA